MKRYRFLFGMMTLGVATFASAAPLTPAQQAFADAQALAASAQANAVSNLSSGGVSSTVNQFNPTYYNSNGTAPESTLFQSGNGNTVSAGQTKVADCQTGTPNPDSFLRQNCEAINLMVNNPSNRPQFSLPASMFASSRAIEAQGVTAPNATGNFTSCVDKTVGAPPVAELCREWFGTSDQQCTMGRVVLVDEFTNYQCDKTTDTYLPQTCDKTVNVVVTQPAPVSATVTYTHIQGSFSQIPSSNTSSTDGVAAFAVTCNTNGSVFDIYGWAYAINLSISCTASGCYGYIEYVRPSNDTSSTWYDYCPSVDVPSYTCPSGTTLTGSGTSSTCIYPAVVTSTVSNGCAVQEAAAL